MLSINALKSSTTHNKSAALQRISGAASASKSLWRRHRQSGNHQAKRDSGSWRSGSNRSIKASSGVKRRIRRSAAKKGGGSRSSSEIMAAWR